MPFHHPVRTAVVDPPQQCELLVGEGLALRHRPVRCLRGHPVVRAASTPMAENDPYATDSTVEGRSTTGPDVSGGATGAARGAGVLSGRRWWSSWSRPSATRPVQWSTAVGCL